MVYNGISRELNEVLWDPHFTLPTMSMQMRALQLGTSMGDIGIGEILLNSMVKKSLRNVCAVGIMHIQLKDTTLSGCESQRCSK